MVGLWTTGGETAGGETGLETAAGEGRAREGLRSGARAGAETTRTARSHGGRIGTREGEGLVARLKQQSYQQARLRRTALDQLRGRETGQTVALGLPGLELRGRLDSVLIRGGAAHYGFTLERGLGRVVVTLVGGDRLGGHVFLEGESLALTLSGSLASGGWMVTEDLYENIVCSREGSVYRGGAPSLPIEAEEGSHESAGGGGGSQIVPILNSRPGAEHLIYLDFDGETISHPYWNRGAEIVAAPHARHGDPRWVTLVWRRVAEDWAPFEINVTTDRGLFDDAMAGERMHCIITPTNTAAPGAGGVAIRGGYQLDIPCWAFNGTEYACAETISHEVGHTMGLSHDGRSTPPDAYYGGHGNGEVSWSPIMGAAWSDFGSRYYESVTQWSRGEYQGANNVQDDLALIARDANGFGHRADDKGSSIGEADQLHLEGDAIADSGVIERTSDEDWFEFTTAGGDLEVSVRTLDVMSSYTENGSSNPGANLAVDLRLYDASGVLVEISNPSDALDAEIARNLSAGIYFLHVAGAARGDGNTGFTDYASLGQYKLTGTVPAGVSGPEISVAGNGSPIPSGSMSPSRGNGTDFGRVDYVLGQSYDREFVVTNHGGQLLELESITEDSERFSLLGPLPTGVPAGSSASFILRYTPVGPGGDEVLVTIHNNDANEGTYSFRVSGQGIHGAEDDEFEENDSIANAHDLSFAEQLVTTGVQADDDWYEIHVTTGFTRVLAELDFVHAEGDIDLALFDANGGIVASSAGTSNREVIDLDVGTGGTYYLLVHYEDAWNRYDLRWDDLLPSMNPEIEVLGGGDFAYSLSSGADTPLVVDGTDFGQAALTGGVVERSFRIENLGPGPLVIDSAMVNTTEFTITADPSGTIPAGSHASLGIRFDPSTIATHEATVTIACNDPDEDPFTFLVRGTGVDAVTDDAYEENDTLATAHDLVAEAGTWISGIQLDEDWFAIQVPPSMNRLRVDCTFIHAQGDIDIDLVDSLGRLVGSSRGVVDDESIDTVVDAAGGSYFIRVYYGGAGNAYELKWEASPPDAPEIEVLGGPALDVAISDGDRSPSVAEGTEFGNLNIHGENFTRTFAIRNSGSGMLTVHSVHSDSGDFSVLPGYPESVLPGAGEVFRVSFDPTTAGARQAVITVLSDDPDQGAYDFLVEGVATDGVPDDSYEENNSAATAYDLSGAEDAWLSTILGPGRQSDADWYRVETAPNHDRLVADCSFTHAEGDIDLKVFDGEGVLLGKVSSITDDEHLEVGIPGPGTYFIVVHGYPGFGNQGNSYDLVWDQLLAPDDAYEENDELASAFDLTGNERNWLSNLDGPGRQRDEDWYRFDVTSGYDEVRVHCEFIHAHGDIDISLHDSSGAYLDGSAGVVDNESIVHSVLSGETYYVRVHYGDRNNLYDLWWDDLVPGTAAPLMLVTGSHPDDSGEGTSGDADGRLDPGETATLEVELENRGTLPATGVTATLSTTDPRVTLISNEVGDYGDLNVRRSGTWTYGFSVSPTASAGTIQFDLAVVSGEGSWSRTVNVELTDGDDLLEPNDTLETACDLREMKGDWIAGNQLDSDWYRVDVDPDYHRLHVDCHFLHAEGDIDIQLFDSGGNLVDGSYGTEDNEEIVVNLPGGGEHYIRVFFGDQGNAYTLRWFDSRPIYSEIAVEGFWFGFASGIESGDGTPDFFDGTDFEDAPVSVAGTRHRFRITNEGEADLVVHGISVDEAAFSADLFFEGPIGHGESGEFDLVFSPESTGLFTGTVSIDNSDPDEGDFTFAVAGIGTTDDAYEENDTLGSSHDLGSLGGVWLSEVAGDGISLDEDWYRIEVAPGFEFVHLECRFTGAKGNITLELFDQFGTHLASSGGTATGEAVDFLVASPGSYHVKVGGSYNFPSGLPYDLRWAGLYNDGDIDDDGLPNEWERTYSPLGEIDGMDPLGNPDGDPFPHWAEFALNTHPYQFSDPVKLYFLGDTCYFEFTRNKEAVSRGYRFEVLEGATPATMTPGVSLPSAEVDMGSYETVILRSPDPVSLAGRRFFQLELSRPPLDGESD